MRHSNSKNLPYYFNEVDKVSRWEPPVGTDIDKLKAYLATHHKTAKPSSDAPAIPKPREHTTGAATGADESKIRAAHLLVKHRDSRRPASRRQAQITRSKEDALEELRGYEARIRDDKDAATLGSLAYEFSDCSSYSKSGDLGFFSRGMMQKEFEDAAFALAVDEMSGPVETASGVHLIQRYARPYLLSLSLFPHKVVACFMATSTDTP